ncbi:RadC family protein [Sneathiella glossodoripedis]|uniref:RadC family protein n=1 Tax=Sneathiella glossodoripedis TaxID=418853 RepID=UPI00046FFD84|nr:DNA repair protein RadC [Sneathiella glossodoripedis]
MTSDEKTAKQDSVLTSQVSEEQSPQFQNLKNTTFSTTTESTSLLFVEDSDIAVKPSGHRERMRQRVLAYGGDSLADYELLEMLLFAASPRKDTKPLAKLLLKKFKTLGGVLATRNEKLREIPGVGDSVIATIRVAETLGEALLRSKIEKRNVLGSWQALLEYCQGTMGRKEIEHFRILFLNNRNHLIADEVQQTGTINQAAVYPREVVKRSLELGATSLILVHNHPSGDTSPSKADIRITEDIINATSALGITIHDHLIVSSTESTSMRSMGLI